MHPMMQSGDSHVQGIDNNVNCHSSAACCPKCVHLTQVSEYNSCHVCSAVNELISKRIRDNNPTPNLHFIVEIEFTCLCVYILVYIL